MLLNILDELRAMTSHDELGLRKVIALENGFADASSVIVIDSIDGIVENDQGTLNTLCFG